jgi:hypothetical protein
MIRTKPPSQPAAPVIKTVVEDIELKSVCCERLKCDRGVGHNIPSPRFILISLFPLGVLSCLRTPFSASGIWGVGYSRYRRVTVSRHEAPERYASFLIFQFQRSSILRNNTSGSSLHNSPYTVYIWQGSRILYLITSWSLLFIKSNMPVPSTTRTLRIVVGCDARTFLFKNV